MVAEKSYLQICQYCGRKEWISEESLKANQRRIDICEECIASNCS